MKTRCPWTGTDPLYIAYHDMEWGVPLYDDRKLFEFLVLEGAQAGLSWITILKKREHYRKCFDNFNPETVSEYNTPKIQSLLKDDGLIRNRLKISAAVTNARAFLAVQKEFGCFSTYIWQFVDGEPIHNEWKTIHEIPPPNPIVEKNEQGLETAGI